MSREDNYDEWNGHYTPKDSDVLLKIMNKQSLMSASQRTDRHKLANTTDDVEKLSNHVAWLYWIVFLEGAAIFGLFMAVANI